LADGQWSIANGQKQKMQKKKRKANFVKDDWEIFKLSQI